MRSDMHPASLPTEQLLASCRMRLLRRGGPGGQHRNKVESAVALVHLPTGVSAEANERRDQSVNRNVALFRLRVNLALAVRQPRATDAAPSATWRNRCSPAGAIRIRRDHEDFPALLAEAMDAVAGHEDDPRRAAESLGCTASQLVKFLKKEPRALAWLNARRQDRGLRPMR
jgi:hypothetical protein